MAGFLDGETNLVKDDEEDVEDDHGWLLGW